jgi:transposase
MISIGAQRRVFVSTRPVDFRKGVHGLVALVAEDLKCNPYCGDVYVFRAKRKDRLKLLLFDGSGTVLATKWLENSDFAWPPVQDGVIALTPTQFAMLFDGLSEWARIVPKSVTKPNKTA